jgi:hypothetical protein
MTTARHRPVACATASKGRPVKLHNLRIALAAIIVALAAVSAVDSASAGRFDDVVKIELQAVAGVRWVELP